MAAHLPHVTTTVQEYFWDPLPHLRRTLHGDWLRKCETHLQPWIKQTGLSFQRETNRSQRKKSFGLFQTLQPCVEPSVCPFVESAGWVHQSVGRQRPHSLCVQKGVLSVHPGPEHPSSCVSFQEGTVCSRGQRSPHPSFPASSDHQEGGCAHSSYH